jgi:hypothetical protein
VIQAFVHAFNTFFPSTHAIGYQLFKNYAIHCWETERYSDAIEFMKKMFNSIEGWKKYTTIHDIVRLEAWAKIVFYLILTHKYYQKYHELSDIDLKNPEFTFQKELAIHLFACHEAIQNVFEIDAMELDMEIYPLMKQSIQVAFECVQSLLQSQ